MLEEECYIKVAILDRASLRLYLYFLQVSQLRESVTVQSSYSKDSFMKQTAPWPRLVLGPGFASPCFVSARYQSGLSMD